MKNSSHNWRFYLSPAAAWEGMYDDCQKAKESIELEQYIFCNDTVGRRFMRLFIAKARRGIKITLILDAFGSASFVGSSLVKELQGYGGYCYFYNKVRFWDLLRPWRWFPRMHVKSLLVDSEVAYTGGVCFAAYMHDWRDTHLRVTGPVIQQFRFHFDRSKRQAQHLHNTILKFPNHRKAEFTYIQSVPLRSWFAIYFMLITAIRAARHNIDISTPYLAPNRRFRHLLHQAAQRGVVIRLLVPQHSDNVLADCMFLSYARELLRKGIKIYLYQRSVLHNKTVVIDDDWCTIGSTNMDVLSFFRNREANLVIMNSTVVQELTAHFKADLREAKELSLDDLAQESAWKFIAGYLARFLKLFI